jgi:hypothetical protein
MRTLYRAVSKHEEADIIQTNSYRMPLSMPTGTKYFVGTLQEGRNIQAQFTSTNIFNDGPYTLTHGDFFQLLPPTIYIAGEGDAFVLDESYFPNTPVTVLP